MKLILIFFISISSWGFEKSDDKMLEQIDLNSEELKLNYFELNDGRTDGQHSVEVAYSMPTAFLRVGRLSGFSGRYSTSDREFGYSFYAGTSEITLSEATSISGNFDSDEETLSVLELGVGFNRRSLFLKDLIEAVNYDDEISVVFLYSSASTNSLDLTGYGMLASYAIRRYISESWSIVGRLDYHLHSLEDTSLDPEVEVTASWMNLSIGLNVNF